MRFYGSLVLAMILILESTSLAESVASVRSKLVNATVYREPDSGPLCGVHATSIALRLVGVSAFEGDFLTTKYISSCQGSRAEDICAMVEVAGGRASQLGRLSAFDIRTFSGPIVANVRRNPGDDRFNHWVVVLVQRDGVVVYDGLDEPRQMSMGEFLGVWSGIGILVSNAEANPIFPLLLGRAAMLLACGLGLTLLVHYKSIVKRRLERLTITQQIGFVSVIAIVGCFIGNTFLGDLAHHQESVRLASAHTASQYKTGTLEDVIHASNNPSVLLVDARRHQDFLLGSVPLAVNLPVDAGEWETRNRLEGLDKSTKIFVFCQSKACRYDESVAKQLVGIGFEDVTVSDEGWREYVQRFANVDSKAGDSGSRP